MNLLGAMMLAALSAATWMGSIPNERKLSQMSIPGTHDSGALYGGAFAKCQIEDITAQLALGIRFLDIRCRHVGDRFAIHHGPFYQRADFGDVIGRCRDFLRENPSECIIMSVKEEYRSKGCTRPFAETFREYLSESGDSLWYAENRIPELGEVRGRIVILSRFRMPESYGSTGIDASRWRDDASFPIALPHGERILVQDEYRYDGSDGESLKWRAVRALLDKARDDTTAQALYLNFTSATGIPWNTPRKVARRMNARLEDHLGALPSPTGTVVMDFPDPGIIIRIISANFIPLRNELP